MSFRVSTHCIFHAIFFLRSKLSGFRTKHLYMILCTATLLCEISSNDTFSHLNAIFSSRFSSYQIENDSRFGIVNTSKTWVLDFDFENKSYQWQTYFHQITRLCVGHKIVSMIVAETVISMGAHAAHSIHHSRQQVRIVEIGERECERAHVRSSVQRKRRLGYELSR